ncbi:subtype B tannase [Flavobacterium sp. RHBU_3]|uniref:subtype B tannase n=1 Tax=Flavobacterium sp. RHBU_3 TaxID=3391184 RepID=UPI003984D707
MKIILITCSAILLTVSAWAQKKTYSLDFNAAKYDKQTLEYNGKKISVRAYENIVYVANPIDTTYQVMNIYVPEAFFKNKEVHGYNAATAPIFFPNQVGGYMPAKPASTKNTGFSGPPANGIPPQGMPGGMPQGEQPKGDRPQGGGPNDPGKKENTVVAALAQGYVVASAGARGRTNKDADGLFYGKAPAAIVDLKAAVRYLKFNDKAIPGDANKIISNGTSAGGAMSALLGATGDNADYLPYLKALGAANTSDAVFASSDYCPITNLDNADAAYEWQFNEINTYKKGGFGPQASAAAKTLTDAQIKVSDDLKTLFPSYVNSLQLKDSKENTLHLDKEGNGSFKDYIKDVVIASANKAQKQGTDLSVHKWLTIKNGVVTALDWDGYITYMERQKTPPAFDALDLTSGENNEFGTETIDNQHFTDYGVQHSSVAGTTKADSHIVKMMNPMNYIGAQGTKTAKYWRIRHGSKDKDTGLAVSAILALYLQNHGASVDYALPWDKPHSGDYDLDELFVWINSIAK